MYSNTSSLILLLCTLVISCTARVVVRGTGKHCVLLAQMHIDNPHEKLPQLVWIFKHSLYLLSDP